MAAPITAAVGALVTDAPLGAPNRVAMRLDRMPEYEPENLNRNGRVLTGYGVEDVLG